MRKCVPNEDLPINASHCWDYSYYWWHISRQNLKMIPHPLPSHLDDSAQVEELLIVYMLLKVLRVVAGQMCVGHHLLASPAVARVALFQQQLVTVF